MPKEAQIRVLYVQPGKYPEERVIEHTLAAMQTLVGGDIEAVYPKHKKPAASLERKLNYKGEERLLAKEWYEQQLANYPDVLTVAQVCEVTGYQRHTILKWCSKGLLKTILQTPKYMIPKVWLLEFVTSDFFNEISRKCGKHYAAIKEISNSSKDR